MLIKAAEMAGISPVTLIKEPEAAALYTVKSLSFSVSKGDIYVVCDAGGGTVDLVSYEVEQVLPRLQAREVVPGSGGMAGSIGLNQRFEEELRQVVGDDQWLKLKQSEPFFAAQKQFDEQVKPAFTGDTKKKHYIYFPGADLEDDPENGVRGSAWTMTGYFHFFSFPFFSFLFFSFLFFSFNTLSSLSFFFFSHVYYNLLTHNMNK